MRRHIYLWACVLVGACLSPYQASAQLAWESLAPFVDPRTNSSGIEGAAASIIGDDIYVSDAYRSGDSNLLSIYNIPSNTWTHGGPTAPDSPLPVRSEGAGGTANGLHYSIGGRAGISPTGDTVKEFTPGGGWVVKDALPTPRRGLGTGSLGGLVYAVGGSDGGSPGSGTITGALEVFDPTASAGSQWSSLAPMPVPMMDVEAAIALGPAESGTTDGAFYVFGGRDAAGNAVTNTQIYDIASDTWAAGAPMPTARSNGMVGLIDLGAVEDGKLAVFGGADQNFTNLGVTEFFDPLTNTWSPGPNMVVPASEVAVGALWDSTGVYSIGEGIFGAAQNSVQRLALIPEPSSTVLLALGALSIGVFRRRRNRPA